MAQTVGTSFIDVPVYPFGTPTDYPYRLNQALTSTIDNAIAAYDGLAPPGGGGDGSESQYAAINQAVAVGGLGFEPTATKILIVPADHTFHYLGTIRAGTLRIAPLPIPGRLATRWPKQFPTVGCWSWVCVVPTPVAS